MIFCVEDDNNIRDLLVYTLETTGFHARGLEDSQELWKALAEEEPELILLDIMLPGEDGYSILEKLKKSSGTRDIPIIMVTAKEAEFDKVRALEAGADDYITKPFGMMEFIARVKAVLRRSAQKEENVENVVYKDIVINITDYTVTYKGKRVEMPPKEIELLYYLASHPKKVFTREQLLEQVWGFEYFGDSRTVDVHIKRIREKVAGNDEWNIKTVWGIGYKFEVMNE